jgi:hypothetical protein
LFFGLKPEAVFAGFDCAMVEKPKVVMLGRFATATVWLIQTYEWTRFLNFFGWSMRPSVIPGMRQGFGSAPRLIPYLTCVYIYIYIVPHSHSLISLV